MTEPYGTPVGDAAGSIARAIVAANYQQEGVPFGPFVIGALYGAYTTAQMGFGEWNSQRGDFPISFYNSDSGYFADSGYYAFVNGFSVGGFAVPQVPPSPIQAAPFLYYLAPKAGVPAAVAPATDMPWVLDDHGSRNPSNLSYRWPTAPKGFHALGTAIWFDVTDPSRNNGACVAAAFLEPGVTVPFWSDTGQDWSHNGDLFQVRLATTTAPTAQLRFAPGTLISAEAVQSGNFDCGPWTLVADAPMLPIAGAGPPSPDFTAGSSITGVTILPGLTMNLGAGHGAFCYLAATVSWESVFGPGWPMPITPTLVLPLQVGMDAATAARLNADIGAECGALRGLVIPPGANGYVSVDLSAALGVEPIPGATADSDTITVDVAVPPAPYTETTPELQVQQQVIDLLLYDANGAPIGLPYRFRTTNYVRQLVTNVYPTLGAAEPETHAVEPAAGGASPGDGEHRARKFPDGSAPPASHKSMFAWIRTVFKWLFLRLRADK